ncbi:dethiobiotin synthase [Neptunicella sp. SCSIO 80796]|uniref:dethiobiotin synthase n=1 Tax=Neptunicella plasticusilytica TaxID=3117012 RepID=UPI003A4E2D38
MKKIFITATDTEAGKTFMTEAIMKELTDRRYQVLGFKPVAAGCEETADGLRNADALALQARCSKTLDYQQINPVAFKEPVAPHLAAKKAAQQIDLTQLNQAFDVLQQYQPDFILTEGAGGWRLPLSDTLFLSDLAIQQQMSVVLVVPVRLGCLNHARLTAEAIAHDGLIISGWIANIPDSNMAYLQDNLEALQTLIDAPLIGKVPQVNNADMAAPYLDVTPLL